MEKLEHLLSDKFAEFSQKVVMIAANKKKLKDDFKEVYDKFQNEIKTLDQTVLDLQKEFEDWKRECALNSGDG
jgi:predicted  nucleic acid-binding Zn-ribbon protein